MRPALIALLWATVASGCQGKLAADAGPDQMQAGFGKRVTLDGSKSLVPRGARIRWTQVEGPPVSIEGADGLQPRLVTPPLPREPSEIPGVLGISHADSPTLRFRLELEDGARRASAETAVRAAPIGPGTGGAAIGADVYLNGGPSKEGWAWTLTRPDQSKAVLIDADTRTPHFRPDLKGAFVVSEAKAGISFDLWAGRYDIVPTDCGRPDCHPREEERWKKTRHAKVGKDASRHVPACVPCHAVAVDPAVASGGFDEACPGAVCPEAMWPLESVSCLACHGPGFRTQANYAEGMCAQCHDLPPRYTKVAEWRRARMSRLTPSLPPEKQAMTAGCPDCHSSQGFVRWQNGKGGKRLGLTFAQPVACPTCHDPHGSDHPRQLRVFDRLITRSGLQVEKAGAGALCMSCHNAGQGEASAAASLAPPHAPQADLVLGGPHPADCTACHMAGRADALGGGHTFRVISEKGEERIASCLPCHADLKTFDWKSTREKVRAGLARAALALGKRAKKEDARAVGIGVVGARVVLVDAAGAEVGKPSRDTFARAYRYLLVLRDRSVGLHNPKRALTLLAEVGD